MVDVDIFENVPIIFGGDYNPEQWPEEEWQTDINKLKSANINAATINVFSWSIIEPRQGEYHFEMLDKIVSLLKKNDFNIIFATSTGAIPFWISKKYPQVSRVDVNGVRQVQGKRHNACPNSPIFRRLAGELVYKLAERYSDEKNLVAWHVSNEYEGYCYCDICTEKYREWLKQKYNSLSKLNKAWNSNFWSHTINNWDEIYPPMMTTDLFSNGKSVLGGAEIDYREFQTDSLLNNFILERNIIKKLDKKHPITTNFMGSQKDLDYFKWAPELDIISWDSYPQPDSEPSENAMEHDLMRGLKRKPFILMEQTPNQQSWHSYNKIKRPNEMRMLSYQAIAHGANSINFFQLKQSRSGAEKFHGAVLTLGSENRTRTYRETKQLGEELKKLPKELLNTCSQAKVAIVFDWKSYWGIENSIGPVANFNYVSEVQKFYKPFYDNGIPVDIVSNSTQLNQYKIVVAPVMYMWNSNFTQNIKHYVANGGTFLTTYLSGIVDENDNIFVGGYLAPLKEVLGIRIDERDTRSINDAIEIIKKGKAIGKASGVCDLVIKEGAKEIAHYSDEVFYSDYSTLTVNNYGKGRSYYCGASLDGKGIQNLVNTICDNVRLPIFNEKKEQVEMVERITSMHRYFFVINTQDKSVAIKNPLPGSFDILGGKNVRSVLNLGPFDVLILSKKKG